MEVSEAMMDEFPELREILGKIQMAKSKAPKPKVIKSNTKPKSNEGIETKTIESGPFKGKVQTFFDDKKTGIKEGQWDEKHLKDMPISERRPPVELVKVICKGCGKNDEISPTLYDPENSHFCSKCISKSR